MTASLARGFSVMTDVIKQAEAFGYEKKPNGAELYGHIPHRAPMAWLHTLYPGLKADDLEILSAGLGRPVPDEVAWVLERSNGVTLFFEVDIYGMPLDRTRSAANRQPFDIVLEGETRRRSLGAPDDLFFFGGASEGHGSCFYLNTSDRTVHRCTRQNYVSLNSWPDLGAFMETESLRLATRFDGAGREIDEGSPLWLP